MREYWIYQERQCPAPWAMMLEVFRADHRVFVNVYIYSEALNAGNYALILDGLHYSRCWQFALHMLCEMAKAGIEWVESDFYQLERALTDVFNDFIDLR